MFEFSIVIVNHVKELGPFIDLWLKAPEGELGKHWFVFMINVKDMLKLNLLSVIAKNVKS